MIISRADFLDELTKVKPGVAKRDIIEQMTHFIFTGDNLVTYDDKLCVSKPFNTDFKCSVKAKDLYHAIATMTSTMIDIDLKRSKLILKGQERDEGGKLPVMESLESQTWDRIQDVMNQIPVDKSGDIICKDLPSDFINGAFMCMFSASKNESQGTMPCISVSEKDIIAGDSQRASWYELSEKMDSFLVKAASFSEMKTLDPDDDTPIFVAYAVSDAWVHFFAEDGLTFSIRRVIGDMVPWKDIFEANKKGKKLVVPSESLLNAIRATSKLTDEEALANKRMKAKLSEGKMKIVVDHLTRGMLYSTIDVPYEGDETSFITNPALVTEVLKFGDLNMIITDRLIRFDTDQYHHIIIRLEE